MAGKNTAAFGIYRDQSSAEAAVQALRGAGFRVEDLSILMPENLGSKELNVQKATKGPEGTATGAGVGAAVGGTLGLLAGIGALAIPGIGPLIAAGPIVASLAGLGAGGAVGGLAGGLIGMGMPEYEAKRYEGYVSKGGILLSVHCDNSEWVGRAKDILKQTGASDVSSTGESSADGGKSDRPYPRSENTREMDTDYSTEWRQHYTANFADTGVTYEECAPAYEFGRRMGTNEQYQNRSFNDVEPRLREEYERKYPGSAWSKIKSAVRYGWDRVTGKAARSARG